MSAWGLGDEDQVRREARGAEERILIWVSQTCAFELG